MKTNMMRAPLIKSGLVLLLFALLAYQTSSSPEVGVLGSLGLIIVGIFRFIQWSIAMVIALAACIAFLIGIFLFAASLVDKESAAAMYEATKRNVAELLRPVFASLSCLCGQSATCCTTAAPAEELKAELQALISNEMTKVTASQQALNEQFAAISSKLQALEAKSGEFVASTQLEAIAGDIAASTQALTEVKTNMANLEGKLKDTTSQLQGITPDKVLGDLPSRMAQLEAKGDGFDPQPLAASVEALQKEMEEIKKKSAVAPGKARKKS